MDPWWCVLPWWWQTCLDPGWQVVEQVGVREEEQEQEVQVSE